MTHWTNNYRPLEVAELVSRRGFNIATILQERPGNHFHNGKSPILAMFAPKMDSYSRFQACWKKVTIVTSAGRFNIGRDFPVMTTQ